MTQALLNKISEYGEAEHPVSNVLFSLHDPDTVWIVESGKVDIFLVQTKEGELAGPRFHVLRAEESSVIAGMPASHNGMALAGAATPRTTLKRIRRDRLTSLVSDGDEVVSALIEQWISDISAAVSNSMASGPSIAMEAGDTVAVGEESRAIVPRQQTVWVRHRQGHSSFLGNDALPNVNGTGYFPVSRYGWLQALPGSEIEAINFAGVSREDPDWRSLDQFHFAILSQLALKWTKAAEAERERMRARAGSDLQLMRSAIRRLASPMREEAGELDNADSGCRHPVFLACEAIGKHLGVRIKPHPDMLRGLPVADPVAAITKASAIRARRVSLKGRWWAAESNSPLLAFRESDNRPLAILPRSAHKFEAYDPVEGTAVPLTQEFAASLNPVAFSLYKPFPAVPLGVMGLLRFGLAGCKREIMLIGLSGVAAGLLALGIPYATGIVFDRLIPSAARVQLIEVCVFLLSIAISTAMLTYARNFAVLRLEGKMDAAIQAAVWDRLLSLPVSFFRDYSSGDLAERSMGISHIREMLTNYALTGLLSGIFSIFSFIVLFFYSWQLALVSTGVVLVAVLVTLVCGAVQIRHQRALFWQKGAISSKLLQFVLGIPKFRVSGTESRAFASWARDFARQKQLATAARNVTNALTVFNSVYATVGLIIIIYWQSAVLADSGSGVMTTGQFLAFLAAFTQFLTATLSLSSTLVNSLSIVPIYERAAPILRAVPEVNDAKATPGRLGGTIEVSHVSFRYRADTPPVLRDVSFRAEPGQFIALVGSSGSGKSTLLRLLLGFEAPVSGAVYYDGLDFSGLDAQEVRRQIGVVLQSSKPANGSIYENIVGSAPFTIEDAWEAARLAGFDEDVKKMPMGMHTYLTEGGSGISGGQRQRLLISRALVSRPRILIFDEATSALDNRTQDIVSRSLEGLQATRIVIAHRLSTILNADCIHVLDRGNIVQSGTYKELVDQEGPFRELVKRQMS